MNDLCCAGFSSVGALSAVVQAAFTWSLREICEGLSGGWCLSSMRVAIVPGPVISSSLTCSQAVPSLLDLLVSACAIC